MGESQVVRNVNKCDLRRFGSIQGKRGNRYFDSFYSVYTDYTEYSEYTPFSDNPCTRKKRPLNI